MDFKWVSEELNILAKCKRYGLPVRQCPQFWFLVMGTVIIITALTTYMLGTRYVVEPATVSLIVIVITIILFVVTFSIVHNLEGLAEANRLKSEFISVVSHQLRSPLSNLKWAIEILASGRFGNLEKKQEEYLAILQENSDRMGELVADLLMVSRIEQGRLPFKKTQFSLRDLAREVVDELKILAEASNVEIKFEASESLSQAWGDPQRIKVVVENLLDNAIRYIKERGEVKIRLQGQGGNLLFEIKDTGVGIPREDQKHIFQRFFRSQNVLKYQTQGSGLGLNIAQSIIERSGGKIWFKSEENKGSTFYFTLPTKT